MLKTPRVLQEAGCRVTVIVIDSAGIGVMPNHPFQDDGANTISNTAAYYEALHAGEFRLPNLQALGLGNIAYVPGVPAEEHPAASHGVLTLDPIAMTDTITGHWGLMGLETGAYPVYLSGLPRELMEYISKEVTKRTECFHKLLNDGRNISGTTVIKELGNSCREENRPIIYTSADSVYQIAHHVGTELEEGAPLPKEQEDLFLVTEGQRRFAVSKREIEKLYTICHACRAFFDETEDPAYKFLRVIARPFATRKSSSIGQGSFIRITSLRRDYTLTVPGDTILDAALRAGYETAGIGKFGDIFSGKGIQKSWPDPAEHRHLKSDMEGIDFLISALRGGVRHGIVGVNLVDCDEQFGHRNDPEGYARNLMAIDARLPEVFAAMGPADVVIITADHGNDPTRGLTKLWAEQNGLNPQIFQDRGTNHTREFVPLLAFGNPVRRGVNLGIQTMAGVAATTTNYLGIPHTGIIGPGFWGNIAKRDVFVF